MLIKKTEQSFRFCVVNDFSNNMTVTGNHAENWDFTSRATTSMSLFIRMFILFLAAYIGFISFNNAFKKFIAVTGRHTDSL